ncbi:Holliday junction DNA helicase RuvA [Mediterraneibacter gnavus ATCC 29149]|nr:Holliday junction branch migration protein RuvA [Mediterraneibacter gnavus]EDN77295.1 Holliday junction DNA helicase RuvA [Mediterraneibacter gnavus ATCC 29149]
MKNKTAYFGVFTSLALILSYVETLIPISFGIPGIKLGLANLVIVIVLYTYGGKEAFLLSVTRILLSGFLFGNLSMILYSMAGGVFSLAIMVLLRRTGGFSIQGVSIAGGVFHNIGQLLLAMMIVETYQVGYYFPVLLISGLVTGLLIGIVSSEVLKRTAFFEKSRISIEEKETEAMISYIRGELAGLERDKAIVDVQGVGYGIYMPEQSLSLLGPIGCEVKIHTYLNVREDAMQLFGFLTRDDLEVFRLVIGVSGIGPKGGLNILSCLSADELKFAVLSGDAKAICAAPGIGKKTAEKLIIELKDKLDLKEMLEPRSAAAAEIPSDGRNGDIQTEAVQALVALGYGNAESLKAVRQVTEYTSVEDVLKEALKKML